MPLIVERIPGVASASLSWLVPAGVAYDPPGREGLGAMLAELLLRGSGARSSREMADELDRLGILRGTECGRQFVGVAATFVGARAAEVLPLITQMVLNPRMDGASIEPTRQLALQSLAGLADNPQERAAELLTQRHALPPLDRSTLGTEAGLSAVTREDCVRAWAARARPRSCILGVAGDVAAGEVAGVLNRAIGEASVALEGGAWTGSAPVLGEVNAGEPVVALGPQPLRGSAHHELDQSNQVQIYLAHEAPAEGSADARLERIVASVLSGGSAARLFSEVREKRALCYAVASSYAADKLFGRVVAYVGTTPEKAQQSLDVLMGELDRIAGPGAAVERDEFDRARTGYKSRLVASGESSAARAAALASDHHKLGRARSLDELTGDIERTTLDEVNAYVARRSMGLTTIVTLGPEALRRPGA